MLCKTFTILRSLLIPRRVNPKSVIILSLSGHSSFVLIKVELKALELCSFMFIGDRQGTGEGLIKGYGIAEAN